MMKALVFRSMVPLHFSRWNRKGYAIFASLGREVRIGTLAIRMCEMALRKSSRKGVIVNVSEVFGRWGWVLETMEKKILRECLEICVVEGDADGAGYRMEKLYKGKGTVTEVRSYLF